MNFGLNELTSIIFGESNVLSIYLGSSLVWDGSSNSSGFAYIWPDVITESEIEVTDGYRWKVRTPISSGTYTTVKTKRAVEIGTTISAITYFDSYNTEFDAIVVSFNEIGESQITYDPFQFWTAPSANSPIVTAYPGESYTTIDLVWAYMDADPANGGFIIYRDGIEIDRVAGTERSYSDSSCSASTEYEYSIIPFNYNPDIGGNARADSLGMISNTSSATTISAPAYFTGYNEDLADGLMPDGWFDTSVDGGYLITNYTELNLFGQTTNFAGGPIGSGSYGWTNVHPPVHSPVDEAHYSWRTRFENLSNGGIVVELTGICVFLIDNSSGTLTIRKPDPNGYFAERYNSGGDVIATTPGLIGATSYSLWLDVVMVDVSGTMKAQVTLIVGGETTTKPTILNSSNSFTFDSTMAVQPTGLIFHRANGSRAYWNRVRGASFILGDAV